MKYVLIVAAAVVGFVAIIVYLVGFTHVLQRHKRVGHFDVYAGTKSIPDTSVTPTALYYKRHQLTEAVRDYALDPNDADRVLFMSHGEVFRSVDPKAPCGTFLYDGRLKQLTRIRPYPASIGWSPNSHFVLMNFQTYPTVIELSTGKEVDITEAVSMKNGDRAWMTVLQWSPDSQRLAARISDQWDEDLIEVTVPSLSVRYVATMNRHWRTWTDTAIRWSGNELPPALPNVPKGQIFVKPQEALGWTTDRPTAPARHSHLENFCAPEERNRQ